LRNHSFAGKYRFFVVILHKSAVTVSFLLPFHTEAQESAVALVLAVVVLSSPKGICCSPGIRHLSRKQTDAFAHIPTSLLLSKCYAVRNQEDPSMPAPQTLKNHARFNPLFHFTIIPLLILNLIFSIYITIHRWPAYQHEHLWWIVMAIVFILMAGNARGSALQAQDRIVRLEERLRLATLLPPDDRAHINDLTTRQLIALRFASDAELPALARTALTQRLEPKAIKQAIVNWRADHERV
jgi:hypothetical protein